MTDADADVINNFKQTLQKHRRPFDGENLIDFNSNPFDHPLIQLVNIDVDDTGNSNVSSSNRCNYNGPVFELKGYPGFRYCPSALSRDLQLELGLRAMQRYCEYPHATNIDLVPCKSDVEYINEISSSSSSLSDESIWNLWKQQYDLQDEQIPARVSDYTNKRHRFEDKNRRRPYRSLKKLSWSVLGYHYNWTNRCYDENRKSIMPTELQDLAEYFSLLCSGVKSFQASASIVNYYNTKSRMGG